MAIVVELFLRDQVIRGELRDDSGRRVADVPNESGRSIVTLADARARSVHGHAPLVRLGTVQVQRALVLFVVPHDAQPPGPRQFRAGFVKKRPRPAAVGVGPFVVSGIIHVGLYDPPTLEVTANAPERRLVVPLRQAHSSTTMSASSATAGRLFVPVTQAHVTSEYDPTWALDVDVVLVNRPLMSYSRSLSAP